MMGYRQCPGCGVYVLYEKDSCFYCDFDLRRSPQKSMGRLLASLKAACVKFLLGQTSEGIKEAKRPFPLTGEVN